MPTKRVVMTLHGIRTSAKWQKGLADELSRSGFQPSSIDYDYFPLRDFVRKRHRRNQVDQFCKHYTAECQKYRELLTSDGLTEFPSIIAHSFGTYLVAEAMKKYDHIHFDKIILAASILPTDFPWEDILLKNQANAIRHEYGGKDFWTRVVGVLGSDVGTGGSEGYGGSWGHRFKEIKRPEFSHSDFFEAGYITGEWIPYLAGETRCTVVDGRDVKTLDEFERIATQTAEIDTLVYGALPGFTANEATMEQAKSWFDTEPDIYTFLFDAAGRSCLGYTNMMPVSKDTFDEILRYGISDKALTEIASFAGGDTYLYAISIALDPRVKRPGVHSPQVERLLHGTFAKFERLAEENGTRVRSLAAVGWTPQGTQLCSSILGMQKAGQDPDGHPIYRLDFDRALITRGYRPLKHLYKKYVALGLGDAVRNDEATPA